MAQDTGVLPAISDRETLLEQAKAAARAGDAVAMLESLHNAGLLDAIARYVAKRWSGFDFEDATLFVAAAVDRFYSKVCAGETVRNVSAFLFKVALNKANDAYEEKKQLMSLEEAGEIPEQPTSGIAGRQPRDQLVTKALALARSFLPELGQENVQRVMAFDLEAVQKGVDDLPAREVGDALGLTESTVRQCRSRGWQRLRRAAKAHNIDLEALMANMEENVEENGNE